MTNPQLYVLLYPERQEKANVYLEPDCAWIHRELAKKEDNHQQYFTYTKDDLQSWASTISPNTESS